MKYRITILVLALLGIIMTGYLTYLHYAGLQSSFCDLGEAASCSEVNTSIYSKVLGIPVSVLALLYFLGVLMVSATKSLFEKYARTLFLGTILVLIPSFYFTLVEIFLIGSVCIFCELSKVTMIAIAALAYPTAKKQGPITRQAIAGVVVLGLLGAGMTFLIQRNVTGGQDYTSLAQCLTDKGVKMYGSKTCAFCEREKQEFGDAFDHIAYIECHPQGENPQVERCLEHNISHTPTWVIEDEEGNEHKRIEGFQGPKRLAEFGGCPLEEE